MERWQVLTLQRDARADGYRCARNQYGEVGMPVVEKPVLHKSRLAVSAS